MREKSTGVGANNKEDENEEDKKKMSLKLVIFMLPDKCLPILSIYSVYCFILIDCNLYELY